MYDLSDAVKYAEFCRFHGMSVALTAGCFDVITHYHCRFLSLAKGASDRLIMCTYKDETITNLKGIKRPVHHEEDRIEILSEIRYVDCVCILRKPIDYCDLLLLLNPNVFTLSAAHPDMMKVKRCAYGSIEIGVIEVLRSPKETISQAELDKTQFPDFVPVDENNTRYVLVP